MSFQVVRLGIQPETEAVIAKSLYMSDGVDEAVVNEFAATVSAYRQLTANSITVRLESIYGGENPLAVGYIALVDTTPIGMVFGGLKNYLSLDGEVEGVNVSAWVSAESRGLGVGTSLMGIAVSSATEMWQDKVVWTSIDRANIASQKMCQAVGFRRVHPQLEAGKEDRDIYVR